MRPDPVAGYMRANRLTLTKSEEERKAMATPYRPAVLYSDPTGKNHPWWFVHACARVGRILEGAKPTWGAFSRGSAIESACKSAGHPKCARRFMETLWYFTSRDRPARPRGTDHNPFRGLSDRDAYAKWYTLVERICDASTDKLGPWRAGLSETGAARNK